MGAHSLKRLLHVFPSFEVGGQQMRATTLANEMAKDGVHNLILPLNGRTDCAQRLNSDVSYEILDVPVGLSLPARVQAYRGLLKTLKPDRLLTYNWGAIEWGLANFFEVCPHIHIEDGFGREEATGQLRRRVLFRRFVLSGHTIVVFPSQTLYRLARDVWKLPEENLRFVPNGIDLSPYGSVTRDEARARFGLDAGDLVIGTLATLRPEKNLQRLIDAVGELDGDRPLHLVLAGSGSDLELLKDYVEEKGLSQKVSFPGFVDKPHEILPGFDIFALSSDTEQMPLSVLEAMAAGLPVVSTDVGDVKAMVAGVGAELVAGSDAETLTYSLSRLVKSLSERDQLGAANHCVAQKRFSLDAMVETYRSLYLKSQQV